MSLTPAELVIYERAIAKIRRRLFSRYTPTDYFIIDGTEKAVSPSVTVRYQPTDDLRIREVMWGGFRWHVDGGFAPAPLTVILSHWSADCFHIQVNSANRRTMHIASFPFASLDESLMETITVVGQTS